MSASIHACRAFLAFLLALPAVALFAFQTGEKLDEPTLAIGVGADFSQGRMLLRSVEPNGPATRVRSPDGNVFLLEPEDVILSVDGNTIRSLADFQRLSNRSVDGQLNVVVRDWRTGNENSFVIAARPTGESKFAIARDTYLRAMRAKEPETNGYFDLIRVRENAAVDMTPRFSLASDDNPQSSQELLASFLECMSTIRNYVILSPEPKCYDKAFVRQLEELVTHDYERIVCSNMPEEERRQLAQEMCEKCQNIVNDKVTNWAQEKGLLLERAFRAVIEISFKPVVTPDNARVELLAGADMVLTLLQNSESVNPLSDRGTQLLNNSILWRPLAVANDTAKAQAGFYYFRLIQQNTDGTPNAGGFLPARRISLVETPPDGQVRFQ